MTRTRIADASFPPACGAYVVYEAGSTVPLYVGVAATQTIEQRWRRQHLRSRAGGSALRRTLGTHLGLVDRKLNVSTDGRFYPIDVEASITRHLLECEIEFLVANSPEEARALERDLIGSLRPTLNVQRR